MFIKHDISINDKLTSKTPETQINVRPVIFERQSSLPRSRCDTKIRPTDIKQLKLGKPEIIKCLCSELLPPTGISIQSVGSGLTKFSWSPAACARGYVIALNNLDNIIIDWDNQDTKSPANNNAGIDITGKYFFITSLPGTFFIASILA